MFAFRTNNLQPARLTDNYPMVLFQKVDYDVSADITNMTMRLCSNTLLARIDYNVMSVRQLR